MLREIITQNILLNQELKGGPELTIMVNSQKVNLRVGKLEEAVQWDGVYRGTASRGRQGMR
jgi:hypothetical protein